MNSRFVVLLLACLGGLCVLSGPAVADVGGSGGQDGVLTLVHDSALAHWGDQQRRALDEHTEYFIYKTRDSCGTATGSFDENECYKISVVCPGEGGPLVDILRRLMNPDGTPKEEWTLVGRTCLPNSVPGAAKRPTMSMIINAMHKTAWATASVGFQPKGNKTLVTLSNFYRASWSSAGYGPGEVDRVDPATMYGYQIDIRPKVVGLTYRFGDGESFGPTMSLGGVFPAGDVRHSYAKPGTYAVRISVEWGADFRVNGGSWQEIPETVTVEQPPTTITVVTATNRLVTR